MANIWGKMETETDFIFLGSKITVDCDYSHEIKTCLFIGRKAMTNLDGILYLEVEERKWGRWEDGGEGGGRGTHILSSPQRAGPGPKEGG